MHWGARLVAENSSSAPRHAAVDLLGDPPTPALRLDWADYERRARAYAQNARAPNTRRADLDWLRVIAFSLLIFYHAGMAWSGWSWHVTSPDSIGWLREAMRFLNRWRMPLIFVVSGGAVMLALGTRTPRAFIADRLKRLALPLAFGMV